MWSATPGFGCEGISPVWLPLQAKSLEAACTQSRTTCPALWNILRSLAWSHSKLINLDPSALQVPGPAV